MKTRNLLTALVLFAFGASAFAALSPDRAKFGSGPAQFLMTKEELAQWKTIQTDAEADAFMSVFWARRGGDAFRKDFEKLWADCDSHFSAGNLRGSLSDRCKIVSLFGAPTHIVRSGGEGRSTISAPTTRASAEAGDISSGNDNANQTTYTWIWENADAQRAFGVPRLELRFTDRFNSGDFKMQTPRIDLATKSQEAIARMIVRPDINTVADLNRPRQAPQPVAPPPPAAPELKTAAYNTAVADAKSGKAAGKGALLTYAEFVSPAGDYYAPVMLYLPKSSGIAADAADTFFLAVDDAEGKRIDAVEQPAKLTASHDTLFADHTVVVPAPGKYTVTAGLGKAGAPVVVVSQAIEFHPIAKDASGTSKLILSDNIFEMTEPAPEKAPFAFGKLKIVPKADALFTNKDDLNYFVEINNPGIDTATNMPKLQMGIDLLSNGQTISRLPLSEAMVGPLSGKPGPGHYALSDAIPLSKMSKPLPAGDYTLKMKIVDLVTKQSYTLEQNFKITG
jgi:hypothetical protein